MNNFLNKINRFFEHTPEYVRKNRILIWVAFILITGIVAAGAGRFEINMSMEAYFQKEDPVQIAFDRLKTQFEGTSSVYIVYEAKDGDIFSSPSLKAVRDIQDDLLNYRLKLKAGEESPLDHIVDVKTLINASYMEVKGDSLISRRFVGSTLPETEEERDRLRKEALEHPDYPLIYLSEDFKYGGIIIRTDFGSIREEAPLTSASSTSMDDTSSLDDDEEEISDTMIENVEIANVIEMEKKPAFKQTSMPEYADFMHAVKEVIHKPEYKSALKFYPVGEAVIMSFISDIIIPEMKVMMIGLIAAIGLIFFILFRSFSAVIWPILVVVATSTFVIGCIGWTGATMTTLVYLIIYLLLVVGIGDAVHILSSYLFFRNQNKNHETTLRSVFKKSGLACFFTSITTSIGMCSLILIPIVPVRNMGIFSAIGVMAAFAITIFVLPGNRISGMGSGHLFPR